MREIIKKSIAALSLSTFIVSATFAQDINVKGVIADSITHEGEPFATIRIDNANEANTPVSMGTTDLDGNFMQKLKHSGDYRILFRDSRLILSI